jgi:D-glycero-alpha-D-manno-heptose-7-phosphate kinase
MIITQSPFRISFIGGGSDLPDFYEQEMGAVLSATINHYMYISSHPFFNENHIRLKYSKTETVDQLNDIHHPIFREVLTQFNIQGGLEISSNADIPSGTGLGSSSSFTVNVLLNLYTRHHQQVSKGQLAKNACDIEMNRLKEPIGKQDHYAAAYGGLNVIRFNPSGTVDVDPLIIQPETLQKLQSRLLLFYIGEQRSASHILQHQKNEMANQKKRALLRHMVTLVDTAKDALYNNDCDTFGELLHQNWELKKQLSDKISTDHIDALYQNALDAGATGGKLLGAGQTGFLLLYCNQDKQDKLRNALTTLKELPFSFENQGARVIYYNDEPGR